MLIRLAFHTSGLERLRITSGGKISGSAVSTGSFGQLEIGNGGDIVLTEDQRIFFEADKATYIESHAADSFRVVVNDRQMLLLDEDTGNRAVFGNGTKVFIGEDNNFTTISIITYCRKSMGKWFRRSRWSTHYRKWKHKCKW